MAVAVSEYEFEALPELQPAHEAEWEGESESEQFFGALANLARRGASWLTTSGSPQRRFALWAARQALNKGLPAIGRLVGGQQYGPAGANLGTRAASWLSGQLPQREFEEECECEMEGELSPVRKWYPDAMLEHLGHVAAEAESEAEAEALAGSMIPLVARAVPKASPAILGATPGLVCGLAGVVRTLRRSPSTKPLVRVVPAIVRQTATSIARQASAGGSVSPKSAVRTLARQTYQVLSSPKQATQAFRRSQHLDRHLHGAPSSRSSRRCYRCGAYN